MNEKWRKDGDIVINLMREVQPKFFGLDDEVREHFDPVIHEPTIGPNGKPALFVGVSGGRSSALLARLVQTSDKYSDEFNVFYGFCNTSKERQETLDFVREIERQWKIKVVWMEAITHHGEKQGSTHKITDYENAKCDGKVFDEVIKKYGVPNKAYKHCTRELKANVIASYMKSQGYRYYTSAIGFRSDEMNRLTYRTTRGPAVYPLADLLLTRADIVRWWEAQEFDLQITDKEGNCDQCPLKNLATRIELARKDPSSLDWWIEHEERSLPDRPLDIRDCVTYADVKKIAEGKKAAPVNMAQGEFSCMCQY